MSNFTDFFSVASSNNLIEMISGIPDGRSVDGISNTYTLQNVTGVQSLSDSYADVTGSAITYIPPENTKYISYEYIFHFDPRGRSGISHYRLYVDSTEVQAAYINFASSYGYSSSYEYAILQGRMRFVFDLTAASDDIANGKFSNWTTGKTIKMSARRYSSSYSCDLNRNHWMDGAGITSGDGLWTYPLLTVTAYS